MGTTDNAVTASTPEVPLHTVSPTTEEDGFLRTGVISSVSPIEYEGTYVPAPKSALTASAWKDRQEEIEESNNSFKTGFLLAMLDKFSDDHID
jgi:hypothetical protein